MDISKITLVLGGQRSGKSYYAEQLVEAAGKGFYLATAQAFDAEMKERILTHQQRRSDIWEICEEPLDIVQVLKREATPERPILLDCLTLWLSNLMLAERDIEQELEILIKTLGQISEPVVLVSNEVGQGVIPDNALARRFVDCAGRMNRLVAEASDRVIFMTAGLPQILKDE